MRPSIRDRPASPVADIGLARGQDNIIGRDADVKQPDDSARGRFELEESVGKVAADEKAPVVGGEGQTGLNLFSPSRRVGRGEGDRPPGRDLSVGADVKYLNIAPDFAEVKVIPAGREDKAGKA
jgi:hypothetical protein